MNSEDVIVYLTSLVAIGIIVVGLLATFLHSTTLAPIVIIGIILAIFVLLSKGNFSQYLFSLFAKKTINDLNNVNLNDNKSVDKYSKDVHENTESILLRLKGLSIKLFNSKKYYPVSNNSSNYSDEQIDNYFDGLDEYKIEVEKGKVK